MKLFSLLLLAVAILVVPQHPEYKLATAPRSPVPADRSIDWSTAGVPNGIPNRTQQFCDVTKSPYNADKTGASDASGAIKQACSDANGSGKVVFIPAGTYRLNSIIAIPTNRRNFTVRGEGESTVLKDYCSGGLGVFFLGGDSVGYGANTKLTSDGAKGARDINVSSASGFVVGELVYLDLLNDPNLVWKASPAERQLGQTNRISAISGNKITLELPLYWDFTTARQAQISGVGGLNLQTENIGIEDLVIDRSQGKCASSVMFNQTYACWMRNVKSQFAPGYHVLAALAFRIAIEDSTIYDAQNHNSNGGGIIFDSRVSSSRIQNCILYHVFPGNEENYMSGGNVIAYNYMRDNETNGIQGCSFDSNHGCHPVMSLYEGNVGGQFQSDGYHGSASHDTLYRNYFHGMNEGGVTENSKCVDLCRWTLNYTLIGNVLGTDVNKIYDQTQDNYSYSTPVLYRFGYPNMGNNGYTTTTSSPPTSTSDTQARDLRVGSTLIRGGNWDAVTGKVIWADNAPDSIGSYLAKSDLPASLYLSARPAWFGSLTFPPIGPDVSGYHQQIPAQVRYEGGDVGAPSPTPQPTPTPTPQPTPTATPTPPKPSPTPTPPQPTPTPTPAGPNYSNWLNDLSDWIRSHPATPD